jgi:hypothetical protein
MQIKYLSVSLLILAEFATSAPTNQNCDKAFRRIGAACVGALVASQAVSGRIEPTRPQESLDRFAYENGIGAAPARINREFFDDYVVKVVDSKVGKIDASGVKSVLRHRRLGEFDYDKAYTTNQDPMAAPGTQEFEDRFATTDIYRLMEETYNDPKKMINSVREGQGCCHCESNRNCWHWNESNYQFNDCCCCSSLTVSEGGCSAETLACRCCDAYCACQDDGC